VLHLRLPPLQDRVVDIPLLVREILARLKGEDAPELSPQLVGALMSRRWPGNVRELENVLRRLAALGERRLDVQHLSPGLLPDHGLRTPPRTLREAEYEAIRRTLDSTGGNKARAARILGMDRKTLYARLREMDRTPDAEP
jgi:DNA-binding NtrC family response regulator